MKRIGKIIVLLTIVFIICLLGFYRRKINQNNEVRNNEDDELIEVNIIDKNNNLSKIYKKPQEEKYVLVDIIIDLFYL